MRQFARQGDGDAARTRSHICDSQWLCAPGTEPGERNFDQVLSLGPGNQHAGTDLEFQSPEFLPAGEVLSGNTLAAPIDEFAVSCSLSGTQFVFRMRIKPSTIVSEEMHQKQFRGESSGGHMARFERRDRCSQRYPQLIWSPSDAEICRQFHASTNSCFSRSASK